MSLALRLARARLGRTSPNPAVGCVIVRDGRTIARGATASGGRPHAEVLALAAAGDRARGAAAYVSLEPCAHRGQSPSCARALVEARLRRVVIGCLDPYPPVRGRGASILRKAGIEVSVGTMETECRRLNEGFFLRVRLGRPLAILKLAMSLDGRIAAVGGDSRWISSPESRRLVHRWRNECDAVMVGAGTVIEDDPRLTCRLRNGRDPVRVVIDGRLRTPPGARIFHQRSKASTILVTGRANLRRARRMYAAPGVEVRAAPSRDNRISFGELMASFAQEGWSKVLIEGGAELAGQVLEAGVVDRIAFFVAPRIIGCGRPAVVGLNFSRIRDTIAAGAVSARRLGPDFLLEARIKAGRPRRS